MSYVEESPQGLTYMKNEKYTSYNQVPKVTKILIPLAITVAQIEYLKILKGKNNEIPLIHHLFCPLWPRRL